MATRRTRRADALEGDAFGEVQHLHAVVEHRRAGLLEVQPAGVDLAEVEQEIGLYGSVLPNQGVQTSQ